MKSDNLISDDYPKTSILYFWLTPVTLILWPHFEFDFTILFKPWHHQRLLSSMMEYLRINYLPPPNNQLQNVAPHDDVLAPAADYPTKTNPKTYQGKPLEDIFSDFVPFNAIAKLKEPWEAESERDDAFIQGVSSFLWCIYGVGSTTIFIQRNLPNLPSFSLRCGPGTWLEWSMLPKREARDSARGSVKLWQLRKNKACLVLSLHLNQLVCQGLLLASVPKYSVCDASFCSHVWSGEKYSTECTCLPISWDVHSTPGICGPDEVSDKCALWALACMIIALSGITSIAFKIRLNLNYRGQYSGLVCEAITCICYLTWLVKATGWKQLLHPLLGVIDLYADWANSVIQKTTVALQYWYPCMIIEALRWDAKLYEFRTFCQVR